MFIAIYIDLMHYFYYNVCIMRFTITIYNQDVIKKLNSLDRKKGKYIERLIEKDVRYDTLREDVDRMAVSLKKQINPQG